jgi:hypothetical protein
MLLRDIFMSDEFPSGDKAVYIFLEMIALGFALGAVESLLRGDVWWKWSGALLMGVIFLIAGVKWPQVKAQVGPRFATLVERVAGDRLYRRVVYSAIAIVLLISVGFRIYRHYRPIPYAEDRSLVEYEDFKLLRITPAQKAEFDRLKAPLFRYKAALLDSPEYYKAKVTRHELRTVVEDIEQKHGCLIDVVKIECLPKPPATITTTKNEVDIDIPVKMVADELSKTSFWMIRDNKTVKVRVPITLFVSLTNRQTTPLKIDLLYLDARSTNGWADIRMGDSLSGDVQTMSTNPLVLEAKNASASMKGEYLVSSLYDRIIQPGDKVEGWIVAEYPKGFKYGNSIGDMRISLLAGNRWIASKTFPANPRVYNNPPFDWYFRPLDTLITEDW